MRSTPTCCEKDGDDFCHRNRCRMIVAKNTLARLNVFAQRCILHTFQLLLNCVFVCFGCLTPTQMQEPKASALVKPLSEKVCNSPLEPICILTRAHTVHLCVSTNIQYYLFILCEQTQKQRSSISTCPCVGVHMSVL